MTGGTDGIVRSYDLRMGKIAEDLVGAPISSISPSPTSSKDTLLVSSLDGKLRIFDRSNGTVLQTFAGHKTVDIRSKAAWNYGEGAVLTGDEDGRIWAWNVLDVSLKREDVEYFPKVRRQWIRANEQQGRAAGSQARKFSQEGSHLG